MVLQLPVRPINYPSVLNGRENGKLPDAILWATPGQAGGPTVRLVEPAARAWRAMCAAAKAAGHILKVTSAADSYRTYAQQEATFLARYEPDPFPGYIGERWWPGHFNLQGRWIAGHMWYQKPKTAVAAVPGTSNHGWALACDIGEESDGDSGVESIDDATLGWLIANADNDFGYSAEIQSEKWHWRYYAGDAIPVAVLAYEQEQEMLTPQQALSLERTESYLFWGVLNLEDPFRVPGSTVKPANVLAQVLRGIAAKAGMSDEEFDRLVEATKAAAAEGAASVPDAPLSTADLDAIEERVDRQLDEQSRAGADAD